MDYSTMIHKDLIFLNEDAADRKTLFRDVAKKIRAAGYARDTYEAALNKREDEFPTGVVFPEISVMLPHADPENVNEPFMSIVKMLSQFEYCKWVTTSLRMQRRCFSWGLPMLVNKSGYCRFSWICCKTKRLSPSSRQRLILKQCINSLSIRSRHKLLTNN